MILIKNGRCIDGKNQMDKICDVLIDQGKVIALEEKLDSWCLLENVEVIDASGLIVTAGFIDSHVHLREPGFTYKEDIMSGAKAAKMGGFTSIFALANTKPVVDCVEVLDEVLKKAQECDIHVYSAAAISKGFQGKEIVDMEALKDHGAICFSDDGLPLNDAKFVREAMLLAKHLNRVLSFHEEDPSFIHQAGIHDGEVAKEMGIKGATSLAENIMVARDCMLALDTQAKVCIQHISSKEAVALVRLAKSLGAQIVAEATPHHFSLTQDAVRTYGTLAKMNPPLRTQEDQDAIIEGLKDSTIEIIATDHAPHSMEEKQRPFQNAPSGIIGLETSLALGIMNLVKPNHLSMMEYLAKMSYNVAKFYDLPCGTIEVGAIADIVIFDENERWTPTHFQSKSANSPFLNQELCGKVKITICEGVIVYRDLA